MKTIAIYPGSFNPFTLGHQNILEKAERIFGKENVVVAIGINPEKYSNLEDIELKRLINSKILTIEKQLPSVKVEYYIGFLTDYVKEKQLENGDNIVVVRGLRNGYDFDYEYNKIRFMWDQMPKLDVICLFADPAYMHISSSAYRVLEKIKPGSGHYILAKEK